MENQPIDVLLICPNYYSKALITDAIIHPINLAYLAAYVREKGISVDIIDGRALNYSLDDYKDAIIKLKPKIVGMTVMTSYVNQAVDIARIVKSVSKNIMVVVGGAHISALPVDTLASYDVFDVAVVGEGEETLAELTKKVLKNDCDFSGINGIYYRDNGVIKGTKPRGLIKDLDSLPYPAFDLLPLEKYRPAFQWDKKRPYLMVYANRGCPYNCTFCASKSNFGRTVRFRSPESVVDEIEYYKGRYGVKEIIFYDDTLVINKNHILDLCDIMIRRKLDIAWGCFSTVDAMSFELAKRMKEAGCFTIFLGLESGSERMLKSMNKSYKSVKQARQVVSDVRKAGIQAVGSFIFGVPGETEETIKETIDFALDLPLNYAAVFPVVPFPGSEVFQYAKEKKILPDVIEDWSNFEALREPFILSGISKEKLNYYVELFYKRFYYRWPIILGILKDSLSLYKLRHAILTWLRISRVVFLRNKYNLTKSRNNR